MSTWTPSEPYNELPPPPSSDGLESVRVLKAAVAANKALARLDQAAMSMPNPSVLINTIPLLEAQASSEIENIVTTADALFQHVADESGADRATKETLRYRTALRVGYEHAAQRGLTTATAVAVCTAIHGREIRVRDLPGTRLANPATQEVRYSPPEGLDVLLEKLADWEQFVHAEDGLDPLVRTAVAHYQFEAIHPFSDGNGRTGRILNVLMLHEAGLLSEPVLYLSRYIIAHKEDYYRLLLGVTADGAWEDWIVYMLRAIEVTSRSGLAKISAIRELQDSFATRARAVTRGGTDAELLSVLFEQPYCRIATVVERCEVSRPTATTWLTALADAGLLEHRRIGRERLFINTEFLELLVRAEELAE